MNRQIALNIIKAQYASDMGKGIYPNYLTGFKAGYSAKDVYIERAISLILKHRNGGFCFYVTEGDITPFLIYFNFKINGERKQVSFHSYDMNLEKFMKGSKNYATRWDKGNSRNTCRELYEYLTGDGRPSWGL